MLASWNALSSKILLDSDINEVEVARNVELAQEVIVPQVVKKFSVSKLYDEALECRKMVSKRRTIPWKKLRAEWNQRGVSKSMIDEVFQFHIRSVHTEYWREKAKQNKTRLPEVSVPDSNSVPLHEIEELAPVAQVAETVVPAISKTDFSCSVCSFKIPSTEKPNDLAIINQEAVSIAEKQQMYSQLENKLLLHILNCEHDMIRGNGRSRNWRKLKLRWVYWVKVYVYCTGNRSTIYERSEQSLKERQKKLHKSGAKVQKTVTSSFRNSNSNS